MPRPLGVDNIVCEGLLNAGGQEFIKIEPIEDLPARHAPRLSQFALGSERQARNDQLAHAVVGYFSNGDGVGDSLRRIVEDRLWLELHVEVAAAAIFVPDALPGPGDLQSVGQLARLKAEKFVERRRSKGRVPTPLDASPEVGRAGLDRNLDQ